MENSLKSFFDSPERLPNETILDEILQLKSNAIINQLLEGFPELAVLLNEERQIVAFNSKALQAFNTQNYFDIVGKRIGEAINCIHSEDNYAGCGTTQFCKECGAAKSIKSTNELKIAFNEECRITALQNGRDIFFDFSIHTHPISIENKNYIFFVIKDISNEKRRETLERIFFHDVLNTAGAIKGLAELLPDIEDENEYNEMYGAMLGSVSQLIDEISSQRELRHAEDGNLIPNFQKVSVNNILTRIYDLYKNHELTSNNLNINLLKEDVVFYSDPSLLIRSIGNLTKNALEASSRNEKVELYVEVRDNDVLFNVKNEKIIPSRIQLQIFQRSFSTKNSKGRGIGLYSVKLIIEQYLKGEVFFVSNDEKNTVFTIKINSSKIN